MAAINLDIGGNTRRLDRDIQKTVNRVYTINLKTKGDQPLGRITGQVNEFNKSLDASNARVIAFGASAGIIFGVQRAFSALVGATIEVQKSLQDINVILNVSAQNLQKFGGELFSIAKNTGQSFQEVAKAATEFSRQGLGVEETLKRTSEALILSRLSGLDAAKSVEALTAAVNSYASQAVTATEVVNKFANVDAAFAVSSADLAEALQRVGSSAAQSGVSLNELIAIVTSAQQTTARGGAVIGNSFKTIFTRLQRGKVIDLLESLGISSTDSSGQVKSTIQLLQDLGKVYDNLGSQQQAYVAEQVGGVFQINILKAALADLGKEYSIYSSALNVAAGSTDQAIRRNEELNKTYAAQINALQENARQLAATAGERLLGPSIDRLVGGTNTLLNGFNESDGQGVGAVLGKGILDGIGQFISGPGLALIGGVLLKLFRDLAKFATGSVQELLGLNTAATQQRDLQASISQILAKNPQLLDLALKGEQGLNTAANSLLASLQKQTVELQKQATVAQQISRAFVTQAGVRISGGVPVAPTGRAGKAAGYIPNFAQGDFAREELLASTLGAKNPTAQLSKGTIDGKKFIKNNREVEITGFGKNGDSAVIPNYAKGFVPNFAEINKKNVGSKYSYLVPSPGFSSDLPSKKTSIGELFGVKVKGPVLSQVGTVSDSIENRVRNSVLDAATRYTQELQPLGRTVSRDDIENGFGKVAGAKGALQSAIGSAFEVGIIQSLDYKSAQREKGGDFDVRGGANLSKIQKLFGINTSIADFKVSTSPDNVSSFYDKIIKESGAGAFSQKEKEQNARSIALRQLRTKYPSAFTEKGLLRQNLDPTERKRIETLLGKTSSTILRSRFKASGYIPNFAAIQDAVSRERAAGIPSSQIYLAQERALTSANPMGIGVFNKRDEPTKGSRKDAMRSKGFARGYIPNFAETPESSAAGVGTVVGALVSQLGFLAITLQGSGQQYKESLKELTQANVTQAKINSKKLREQVSTGLFTGNTDAAQGGARTRQDGSRGRDFSNYTGGKTGRAFGDLRRASRSPLSQERRDAAARELRAARNAERTAARGTGGQKLGAGVRAGGFGLGIAAPILAQTISQAIPQETKTGRVAATGVGALGNIGAAAATGAVFGPVGAAVGLAAGALLEIPNFVGSLLTDFPELQSAVQKSSQELTKFGDAGSQLLTSFQSLQTALKDPNTSQDVVNKANEAYAKALSGLSSEDQKRLQQAAETGNLEQEYAKVLSEKTAELKSREAAAELGKATGDVETRDTFRKAAGGALGTVLAGPNLISQALGGPSVQDYVDYYLPSLTGVGTETSKTNQSTFAQALTQGQSGGGALAALEKAGGISTVKQLGQIQTGDIGALEALLNKVIPEQEGKADIIAQYIEQANNGAQDFQYVIGDLGQSFLKTMETAKGAKTAADGITAAQQKETKAKDAAVKATEQIIDSLERNIRMAQMAADTNRALAKANSEFQRNTAFADTFSRPSETVGAIVGQGAPLAEAFSLRESIAQIGFNQIGQIENVKSVFVNDINESIKTAFNEGVGETRGKASGEGTAAEIQKGNTEILKPLAGQQKKAFAVVQDVLNKTLSGGGDINTEAVLSDISNSLKQANINDGTIQKITTQVREAGTKGNLEIQKLKNASINEFKTLAKEQSQKILIAKISQAQKFGGGIGEFINPQDPGQNLFDKVIESTKGFDQFQGQQADFRFDYRPGTNDFQYEYGAAQRARQEMAPEYGRSALQLTDQLQAFTGYTPNAEGKAVKAGVAGVKEFYDKQVKELETVAKSSSTPQIVKDEINAALKEVGKLGGTDNIARIQVAQRTGSLTEAGFEKITGKFQNPVLDTLKQQALAVGGEEGAALLREIETMSSDMLISQDPTVKAINISNSILNNILSTLGGERINAATIEQNATAGVNKTSSDSIQKEAEVNIKKAQQAAMPKDSRTIAEIEAETRAKRDQKYLTSPLAPMNRTTGKQFGSVEEVNAEMTKALALGAINPEQKDYYKVLENFKQNLDPTGGTDPNRNSGRDGRRAMFMYDDINSQVTQPRINQALQGSQQPAAAVQQSFTQQEAAFSSNTSALTTLAGGIESLNSTLSSFETNFANLNNVPGTQAAAGAQQAGAQPNVTTTTNAPVNVVVNAEGGGDIAAAVGQAVQNAIPTIIDKVKVALGQKVPPKAGGNLNG